MMIKTTSLLQWSPFIGQTVQEASDFHPPKQVEEKSMTNQYSTLFPS